MSWTTQYEFHLTNSRIHCYAINAAFGLCVPVTAGCNEFPLAEGLFSTNSAGGWLAGITQLSTLVRSLHRYYALVRLPSHVHIEITATGLPRPDRLRITSGRSWDIPVSVQRVCIHALGLRLRRSVSPLALSRRTVLPSPSGN